MSNNNMMTMVWNVDSNRSAMFLLTAAPQGYRVVKIVRTENEATVTYEKITDEVSVAPKVKTRKKKSVV